jgi:cellulase/cellobiase CelA1
LAQPLISSQASTQLQASLSPFVELPPMFPTTMPTSLPQPPLTHRVTPVCINSLRLAGNIRLLCFYLDFDEQRYVNALAPLLTAQGFPAHFIIDQGRSGVQPTSQLQQGDSISPIGLFWSSLTRITGDWCNVINTGFGIRPTTNTGDALVDAIVWVKPGGESDGTSDSSSARYDAHCGYADALKPAPEAGTWFQAYFEQLLKNANPTLWVDPRF